MTGIVLIITCVFICVALGFGAYLDFKSLRESWGTMDEDDKILKILSLVLIALGMIVIVTYAIVEAIIDFMA